MFTPFDDSTEDARTPYLAQGGSALDLPPLRDSLDVDIAVIGGGITGCSAALHAAEAGARVALLEGMSIGWGASSRNAGHLPAATKHEPEEILRRYGAEVGQRIIDASEAGPRTVAAIAKRHGIACELHFPGIITAAHTPRALQALTRRAAYWQARGRALEVLDRDRLAAMLGGRLYPGGVLDPRGGSINPLAYVRGLGRAAIAAGALLHERTRATGLRREDGRWTVTTPEGRLRAEQVLLCTNAHTDGLWPGLRETVVPVRVVQFMTRPLSDNLRRTILPGRQPMIDTRRVMVSLRMHTDGRLHFGGGADMRAGGTPSPDAALARLRHLFPQLGDIAVEAGWAGWMAFNGANSWQMHDLAPGLLAALGCNGRGVALATLYGRDLARLAMGAAEAPTLPLTPPKRVRLHAASGLGTALAVRWYRLRDRLEMHRLEAENRAA